MWSSRHSCNRHDVCSGRVRLSASARRRARGLPRQSFAPMVHGHAARRSPRCSAGPRWQHEQGTAAPAAYETVSTTEDHPTGGSRPPPRWPPARARARHEDEPEAHPSTSRWSTRTGGRGPTGEGIARSSPPSGSAARVRGRRGGPGRGCAGSRGEAQVREQRAADQGEQREAGHHAPMMAKGRRRLPPPSRRSDHRDDGDHAREMPVISPPMKRSRAMSSCAFPR